jgi:hypothetical protein
VENGSDQVESSTSSVIVEAASEKRTVPQTPEYPMDETGSELASEETLSGPEEAEADLDERWYPNVAISSDESGQTPLASTGLLGSDLESETSEAPAASEASEGEGEDDGNPDLSRTGSITEDSMIRSSDLPPETETKTTEVKKLVFEGGSTPETNGSTNLSAENAGEMEGVVSNLDDLFGDLNTTSGSYVFEEDPDFMSRFQDFALDAQTGMGAEKNGTPNSELLLEFEPVDLRSNYRSESGLTPTGPFA